MPAYLVGGLMAIGCSLFKRGPALKERGPCPVVVFDLLIPALGLGSLENGGVSQLQDTIYRVN